MQTTTPMQEYFQQAIDLDPNFAAGYYGLASAQHQGAAYFTDAIWAKRKALPMHWPIR